jgi:hypothetical protein
MCGLVWFGAAVDKKRGEVVRTPQKKKMQNMNN